MNKGSNTSTKHRFLILGGGTAGWMAALLLNRAFPDANVSLIESSSIGTIGVGEGSTPALKSFLAAVGIPEHSWMPACEATYKSGIEFRDWSTAPGFESYFHPFLTHFDRDHIKALNFNALLRRSGRSVDAHPDQFCYSHYLANRQLCPVTPYAFPFEVQYGYHFNAGLLAKKFKEVALERGVEWRDCKISDVALSDTGDVSHLLTDDGQQLDADFFIDCSGFASLITTKTLGVPYRSYSDALFNDRAVTLATEGEVTVSTQTTAAALANGWAWRIPQQNRVGNGYVYSSHFCSEEQAEGEFLDYLKVNRPDVELRHISFETGRVETVWNKNTLAVGLSQGFLEPLEATALALVQLTLAKFVREYAANGLTSRGSETLNREVAEAFDGVKNYLQTHFLLSNREDSDYWRACRANSAAMSSELKAVLECWFARGDLAKVLEETGLGRHYKFNSWLYILTGMGIFPPEEKLSAASVEEISKVPLEDIRQFFSKLTLNHLDQYEAFERLARGEELSDPRERAAQQDPLEELLGLGFAVSN